ncbi:VOC family protein [Nocardia sp. NPDC047648]|uniref:VOC family protein n=1 Tax=Nocardia sp. NPDC047648 TaxID=3155625 RepID=UPI0033FDE662
MASPAKLAHIVLRTGRLLEMLDWYVEVLDGRVAFVNNQLAFMTYDEEHHRVAFVGTGASERPEDKHTGMHHAAFTYADLGDLLDTYQRLKAEGIRPFWTINHGPTTSLYYADPDGNNIELQIDNFDTAEELQTFFESGAFDANPIGVEFDPDELTARFQAGEPVSKLVKRA